MAASSSNSMLDRHYRDIQQNQVTDDRTASLQNQVFGMQEIVEEILKRFPDRHILKSVLQLRLVCKSWKEAAFKLLRPHVSKFPKIVLTSIHTKGFGKLTSNIRATSHLPLAVQIAPVEDAPVKYFGWTRHQKAFLKKFCKQVVSLDFQYIPEETTFSGVSTSHGCFEFPRLETLKVNLTDGQLCLRKDQDGVDLILSIIDDHQQQQQKANKQLSSLNLAVTISNKSEEYYASDELEDLPETLSHLEMGKVKWTDLAPIQYFLHRDLRQLQSLKMTFTCDNYRQDCVNNGRYIEQLITRLASTLTTLNLELKNFGLVLPTKPLAELLPKLETMGLSGEKCIASVLSSIGIFNNVFTDLRTLTLDCSRLTAQPMNNISLEALGNLETLSLEDTTLEFGRAFLSKAFPHVCKLRRLKVMVNWRRANALQLEQDSLVYLLTGVKRQNIPEDSATWTRALERNKECISNLKALVELHIMTVAIHDQELCPFVLEALNATGEHLKLKVEARYGFRIPGALLTAWQNEHWWREFRVIVH